MLMMPWNIQQKVSVYNAIRSIKISIRARPGIDNASGKYSDVEVNVNKERYHRVEETKDRYRIPIVFEDFHKLKMTGTYEYPVHQHSNYEVIYVQKGPYLCKLNDEELSLEENQILVIKPGDWHQDHLRPWQFHYVLHFHFGENSSNKPGIGLFIDEVKPEEQICMNRFPTELMYFQELERESADGLPFASSVQDAVLEILFWRILRNLRPSVVSAHFRQQSENKLFVERLYRLFEERSAQKLETDEMAEALKISKRTLHNKCMELIQNSPARAFLEYKIEKAMQWIAYTEISIKEISYDLGFENPYHFSRVFKRVTGQAPTEFKKVR